MVRTGGGGGERPAVVPSNNLQHLLTQLEAALLQDPKSLLVALGVEGRERREELPPGMRRNSVTEQLQL